MPWRKVSIFLIFNKVEFFLTMGREAVAPQKVLNGIQTGRIVRPKLNTNDETTKTFYHISRPDGLGDGRKWNGMGCELGWHIRNWQFIAKF